MRVLIISDSHGNIIRLKHVYGFAKKAGLDAIIHCGDWDNVEAARTTQDVNLPIYSVLGNADIAHSAEITKVLRASGVSLKPEMLDLELAGRKIVVNHFPGKLVEYIESGKYDAIFHGHTHQRKNKAEGKTLIVNPGALHRTDNPSFAIYDTDENSVEFIDLAV